MEMLSRREHAEHELTIKLIAKGYHSSVVVPLIADLKAQNLLSDERFSEAVLHVRNRRGYGPLHIVRELKQKGVDDALIDRLIDPDAVCWITAVREVRRKKYGERTPKDYREWTRQARFLQSRGFTTEQIRRAMDREDLDDLG